MKLWRAGLVAAVMTGAVGFGCGGVESSDGASSGATERYIRDLLEDGDNQCGESICRTVTREKNITHLFFDFGDCKLEEGDFTVTVDGEDFTDRLKSQGGPCQELGADFRIEVPGNAKSVEVCVTFTKKLAKDVRIGAKDANECSYEEDSMRAMENDNGDGEQCKPCSKND